MARKTFRVDVLSVSSIENLKKELTAYKNQLPDKLQRFTSRLADVGISVGKANIGVLDDLGNVSSLVQFTKKVDKNTYGAETLMIMSDIMPLTKAWLGSGGEVRTSEVSPSLMYEYGSGFEAVDLNENKNPQAGQGTFPGQTHAFDSGGWKWMDLDGTWHRSKGITPTTPMYKATIEMYNQVIAIAKEVFG